MEEGRILWVDDDQEIPRAYSRLFKPEIMTTLAADGQEGLIKLTSDGPFNLIYLDHNMSGMSGLEFLEVVGKKKSTPPIIMYSTPWEIGPQELHSEVICRGGLGLLEKIQPSKVLKRIALEIIGTGASPTFDAYVAEHYQ